MLKIKSLAFASLLILLSAGCFSQDDAPDEAIDDTYADTDPVLPDGDPALVDDSDLSFDPELYIDRDGPFWHVIGQFWIAADRATHIEQNHSWDGHPAGKSFFNWLFEDFTTARTADQLEHWVTNAVSTVWGAQYNFGGFVRRNVLYTMPNNIGTIGTTGLDTRRIRLVLERVTVAGAVAWAVVTAYPA